MNKKMVFRLLFIFTFSLLLYLVFGFNINNEDGFNNFMFSYALVKGEIPYLDFNTISTPLYMFYQAIFLLISNQYIMFLIGQCILITVMFYILFKEYDKKAYYVLLAMIGLKFSGFASTYNFMCLFMMFVLLYLENNYNKKDYLIGFIIGLCALSKHTIGLFFVLPTLFYYYKDIKRIGKRFIGFMIPWLVLIIYLIINKALYSFIDLCFLGLFDFGTSNGGKFSIWIIVSIVLLIISIIYYIKNKSIRNLYLIFTFFFAFPIFDLLHFMFYVTCFVYMLLPSFKEVNKSRTILIIGLLLELFVFNVAMIFRGVSSAYYDSSYKHLFAKRDFTISIKNVSKKIKVCEYYEDKKPIIISGIKPIYDVSHDKRIDYYNVYLYGNHGYNGTEKMIKSISKMHKQYFLVNILDYETDDKYSQTNKKITKYIIDNSKLIEEKDGFWLYYKE